MKTEIDRRLSKIDVSEWKQVKNVKFFTNKAISKSQATELQLATMEISQKSEVTKMNKY